jgi:hypothetical protein
METITYTFKVNTEGASDEEIGAALSRASRAAVDALQAAMQVHAVDYIIKDASLPDRDKNWPSFKTLFSAKNEPTIWSETKEDN